VASVTISIPDALVPPLCTAIAQRLQVPVPTTNVQRADLVRSYLKDEAKRVLLDYRAQEAAVASRSDDTDGAVSW
jgi:hypothetical protein